MRIYAVVAGRYVDIAARDFDVCAFDTFIRRLNDDVAAVDLCEIIACDAVVVSVDRDIAALYEHAAAVGVDCVVS